MSVHGFETHRCDGSLRARCSIRKHKGNTVPFRRAWMRTDGQWHLYEQVVDFDYDCTYMSEVAKIRFCPWCGKEL